MGEVDETDPLLRKAVPDTSMPPAAPRPTQVVLPEPVRPDDVAEPAEAEPSETEPVHDDRDRPPIAWVAIALVAVLALLAWVCVAGDIAMIMDSRDSPEGLGSAFAILALPVVLSPALGVSAAVAWMLWRSGSGRSARLTAVVLLTAAALAPVVGWGVIFILAFILARI